MDKLGYSIGLHKKSQIIVAAGEAEAIAIATTNGNQEWATLINTICADRSDIPMFLIYKGSDILQNCVNLVYETKTVLHYSENGWTDNSIGMKWLKHFIKYAKPVEDNGY